MGLNFGIKVKRQTEGYMAEGHNPPGSLDEIAARCEKYLREKVADGWALTVELDSEGWYDFDISAWAYGAQLTGGSDAIEQLYRGLYDWAWDNFGTTDLQVNAWWSP